MAAAKLVLEPIFEADFLPQSYGFRPRRSAHQALEAIRVEANRGHEWVLDADVTDCFGCPSIRTRCSARWPGGCRTGGC
jgi:retron-type reverse transcriptase